MGPILLSNISWISTSLSTVIESCLANAQMLERPSLLLVAQPDDFLPGLNEKIEVIRRALHPGSPW